MIAEQFFPESEKLRAFREKHEETFYEFLLWMHANNYRLYEVHDNDHYGAKEIYPLFWSDKKLFEEFADVDQEEIELEQEAMLETLRRMNAK